MMRGKHKKLQFPEGMEVSMVCCDRFGFWPFNLNLVSVR